MAQQPVQTAQTVAPSNSPLQTFTQQASPDAFGAQIGQAEQGLGATLGRASDDLANHAIAFQELNNETIAKDAQDQFNRQANAVLFDPTDGYFTKMGKDALDGYGTAQDQLEKTRQNVLDGLPNDRARLMADGVIVRAMRNFEGSMGSHAQQQRKVWMDGTTDSLIQSTGETALNFYNDDRRWGQGMATVKNYVLQKAEQNGWSPEQTAQAQQSTVGKLWSARIERVMTDDPLAAQDMYRQNMASLDGPQQIQMEKMLKAATVPVTTRNLAMGIVAGHSTPDMPALQAAVEQKESGGNPNALSGKGAAGVMQLMPDTARQVAGQLGIPYDPAKLATDAAYGRVLGQEYLQQMLQRYNGNQSVALAAYNAGPGRVDSWLKMYGSPLQGQVSDSDWINRLPFAETRDYVSSINAASPPKPGTMPTSADVRTNLASWMAQARTAATGIYPGQPEAVDQAVSHVETYAGQIMRGQQFQEQAARNVLMAKALGLNTAPDGSFVQMPNAQRPTDLPSLLSDPASQAAWRQMDPIPQQGILTLLEHNAKGTSPPLTDEAWQKYYELRGQASTDPAGFRATQLADPKLLDLLPHAMTKELMDRQAIMQSKDQIDLEKGYNQQHALDVTRDMAAAAGVPPGLTVKSSATEKAAYNQWVGAMDDALQKAQAADPNHRPPNDETIRKIGASLLMKGSQPGAHWWSGSATIPAFQSPDLSKFTPQISAADKATITVKFQAKNGGRAPTQSELNEIYQRAYAAPGAH